MPREVHLEGYTVEVLDTGPYPQYMVVPGLVVAQTETAILKTFEQDDSISAKDEANFFMECIATNMDNLRNFLDDLLCEGLLRQEIPKWEPATEDDLRPPVEMTKHHEGVD